MGKDQDLIDNARAGNYPACEKLLNGKPKKAGPFASLRRPNGGINSRDSSGYTALHYAALNGHRHIVELLLSYEASCNCTDDKGSSALHLAAWAGHEFILQTLLTHGPSVANVNLTNSDKETSLHCASQHGHVESAVILLRHGADPNIKNCRDETPLDLAALYGRVETVKVLLQSHPELVGPFTAYGGAIYNHTPLHMASRNGHKEIVEIILRTGNFDVNVRTQRGTALHEAALCGKGDVARTLLEAGIDCDLADQNGRTVLQAIEAIKTPASQEIANIILDHIGSPQLRPRSRHPRHHGAKSLDRKSLNERQQRQRHSSTAAATECDDISVDTCSLDFEIPDLDIDEDDSTMLRPKSGKSAASSSRVSSMSGYSDCTTTATLQYDHSFSEATITIQESPPPPKNYDDDNGDTSLSSSSSLPSAIEDSSRVHSGYVQEAIGHANDTKMKKVRPPTAPKPNLKCRPPVSLRGKSVSKPVSIPTVAPKYSRNRGNAAPRKPPRKSTEDIDNWNREETDDYSYGGSKSLDEIEDGDEEKRKRKCSVRKNRRQVRSCETAHEAYYLRQDRNETDIGRRKNSDIMIKSLQFEDFCSDPECDEPDSDNCQACLLSSLSSRTISGLERKEASQDDERFISQRQYKRKISRQNDKRALPSYVTMERRRKRSFDRTEVCNDHLTLVSKTTFKMSSDKNAEMMEIPRSPTNYSQCSTPECDPPSPYIAEKCIQDAIDKLRTEAKRTKRCQSTSVEACYLLDPGVLYWKTYSGPKLDRSTSMLTEAEEEDARRRKAKEIEEERTKNKKSGLCEETDDTAATSKESELRPILFTDFDKTGEWNEITQIIDTFGSDIGKDHSSDKMVTDEETRNSASANLERESTKSPLANTLAEFLKRINMQRYEKAFAENGYDHVDFIGRDLISRDDLVDMGVKKDDLKVLTEAVEENKIMQVLPREEVEKLSLDDWLAAIGLLDVYAENFRGNFFTSMDRILQVWDDELVSILDIEKLGHRKRILLSVAGKDGIGDRFGKVKDGAQSKHVRVSIRDPPPPRPPPPAVIPKDKDESATNLNLDKIPPQKSPKPAPRKSIKSKDVPPPLHPKPTIVASPRRVQLNRESKEELKRNVAEGAVAGLSSGASALPSKASNSERIKLAPKRMKSSGDLLEEKKKKQVKQQAYLTYKVKYYGKKLVKDFRGVDSTLAAIDTAKKSKNSTSNAPRSRYLVLSEKNIRVLKRETKEIVTRHPMSAIRCIVRDAGEMTMFGYIAPDPVVNHQNFSHVFSTDCKGKTSEILMVLCEGFEAAIAKTKSFHQDPIPGFYRPDSPPTKAEAPKSAGNKSDHLVSRMKLFFQGAPFSSSASRPSGRKRGGSVDNLLDVDYDETQAPKSGLPITKEAKRKSLSTKNLGGDAAKEEEVNITDL